MCEEYRNEIKRRIRRMDVSAFLLVLLIISLVFGFLGAVLSFEYLSKSKPTVIASFGEEVWRLRDTINETEQNIEAIRNNTALVNATKANAMQNNLTALSENMKVTSGRLDGFAKDVYDNQGKIFGSYLNEKRVLLIFSGLFVAYLVKLFSGLYKYNAYLKSHYVAVLDALDLSAVGRDVNERIDVKVFNDLLAALSVKHLQIDQGGSFLEGLLAKKEKPDA